MNYPRGRIDELVEEVNKDEIPALLKMLTAKERTVVNVLLKEEYALSPKQIRNLIIRDIYEAFVSTFFEETHTEDVVFDSPRLKNVEVKEIKRSLIDLFDIVMDFESKHPQHEDAEVNLLKSLIVSIAKKGVKKRLSYFVGELNIDYRSLSKLLEFELRKPTQFENYTKEVAFMEKALVESNVVQIPSFRTIKNILKRLEAEGLVVSRVTDDAREKEVYTLNPKIEKIVKQVFE